ncbi:MAG TPA: S8 family serine peptidase [Frankiaceae bacterium]|nr:S8 family serine peptidase [Frankiaceae bacterium]
MRTSFARRAAAALAASATLAALPAVPAGADGRRPLPQGVRPLASSRATGNAERVAAAKARAAGAERVAVAIRMRHGASADDVVAAAKAQGAAVRQRIPQLSAVTVDVPAHAAARIAEALSRSPGVAGVEPVGTRRAASVPNDPAWVTTQAAYLGEVAAPAAWDVTHGSADVQIAVVDTGVDVTHADLAGKVVDSFNAVTGTSDVTDTVGHGTFVAGVAAASTNNGVGVAGAGYDTTVLAVKVADADGLISTDDEAAGIVWAADHGAEVVNISLGGDTTDSMESDAVAYAVAAGVVVVASAGNEATSAESYPAALDGVVAVGATNGASRASFSNHGSWVDVGAPGVNIVSTAPAGTAAFTAPYDTESGTSFSAPIVAAEAALLIAANPDATADDVISAIASTADDTAYGFAAGRVDFAAALASLAPTTTPTLTEPAGPTVSGDVTVGATSTAGSVRFAIDGGPSATADVVDGTATATLETYGLSGAHTITARDCSASGCGATPASVAVTVDNAAPAITSPAPDAVVRTAMLTLSATASGGAVRFLVDGAPVATDAVAPYTTTVQASALAEGAHTASAVLCNRAGTVCDTAHAASLSFTVSTLHPAIPSIAPARFSPNGDGRYDAATVTYTLDVAQSAQLRIKNAAGTVVRGPGAVSGAAGTRTWVWNGRRNDGTYAPDGTYTVELNTSDPSGQTGFASRTVVVDRSAPNLSGTTGSGATFYPVRDGYRDTFVPSIYVSESAYLSLRVYNPSGTRIRVLSGGPYGAGRRQMTWDGKTSSGALAPAGTYSFDFVSTDLVSNARVTGRYPVYVSGRRLVSKVAERVLTPDATRIGALIGDCSYASVPAHYGQWAGSHGYYSDFYCDSLGGVEGLVVTDHQFTLPAAVKYGNVQVAAVGREAIAGFGDIGLVSYYDKAGNLTDYDKRLDPSYTTYWGPLAGSSALLYGGRTLRWWAGTSNGNWYEIAQFKVRWQYFVLA